MDFGDIVLKITEDGSDIVLSGNSSIELDPTLNMSLMVTLFSNKEWFGNCLADENDKIGSDIETIKEVSIIGRKRLEDEIQSSLQYLVNENKAKDVNVIVQIIGDGKKENKRYDTNIKITEPDGTEKNIYWKYAV
ncbi:hypothetical protein [Brachyspira murdochii]|uniref:hypothetical protein n=1 Tax=Brachyspira murdochii TaxID=84378 RepID=UPI0030070426